MVDEPRAWLDRHLNRETTPAVAGRVDDLSLATMASLMDVLGHPERAYPSVHLTGTNGKGSTAAMVELLVRAHGLSVGRYASPHLERLNERMTVNGEAIDDEGLDRVLEELRAVMPLVEGDEPSWFELVTAAAFSWFADRSIDVGVIEVGLLGTFDATNVIDAAVAVVTNIGRDHTDGAPGWRARVAEEKAGIAGPESVLVVGEPAEDLHEVFEAAGAAELWLVDRDFAWTRNEVAHGGRVIDVETPGGGYHDVFVPLHGAHQATNAALALVATEAFFGRPVPDELVTDAFAEVELPGRLEVIGRSPLFVLDGAHNPDGATALADALITDFAPSEICVYVVGQLDGRDPAAFVDALAPGPRDLVVVTTTPGVRGLPAAELAERIVTPDREVEVVPDPGDALARAAALTDEHDRIVVTGSLHLVGDVRRRLVGD